LIQPLRCRQARASRRRPSAAASAAISTSGTSFRSEFSPKSTITDQVGGPKAGMRFTPSTIAKRIR